MRRFSFRIVSLCALLLLCFVAGSCAAEEQAWPPPLKGAINGTVTFTSDLLLKVPPDVAKMAEDPNLPPFIVAKKAPIIDLAYHGNLPNPALNGTGWSAWGDIALARDGRVYSGTGDHGDDAGGKSHAYLYQWDPKTKVLKQVADLNAIVPRAKGEPTWSKVHCRILEGPDGNIYFSGTLNDGNAADKPQYKWSEAIPGGQIFQYNPKTGQNSLFANLPAGHCTATTMIDHEHNIWWCNLEAGPNALWAFDMANKKELYRAPAGSVTLNRNFAMDRKGVIYFNGEGGVWKCDLATKSIAKTNMSLGEKSAGMRASTDQAKDGWIYGHTMGTNQIFRFHPDTEKVELLGNNFLKGDYVTVCVLSPDEKYMYFLTGAHGTALGTGTPVIQYNIATGQRKVIAFLKEAISTLYDYVPGGTYGVKISPDGGTLYVNLNGHAGDAYRLKGQSPSGFGLTAFCAIHIPASER